MERDFAPQRRPVTLLNLEHREPYAQKDNHLTMKPAAFQNMSPFLNNGQEELGLDGRPSAPKVMYCEKCGFVSADAAAFRKHMLEHMPTKYYCFYCNHASQSETELHAHLKQHTVTYPHKCQYCGQGYNRRDYLMNHIQRLHGKPIDQGPSKPVVIAIPHSPVATVLPRAPRGDVLPQPPPRIQIKIPPTTLPPARGAQKVGQKGKTVDTNLPTVAKVEAELLSPLNEPIRHNRALTVSLPEEVTIPAGCLVELIEVKTVNGTKELKLRLVTQQENESLVKDNRNPVSQNTALGKTLSSALNNNCNTAKPGGVGMYTINRKVCETNNLIVERPAVVLTKPAKSLLNPTYQGPRGTKRKRQETINLTVEPKRQETINLTEEPTRQETINLTVEHKQQEIINLTVEHKRQETINLTVERPTVVPAKFAKSIPIPATKGTYGIKIMVQETLTAKAARPIIVPTASQSVTVLNPANNGWSVPNRALHETKKQTKGHFPSLPTVNVGYPKSIQNMQAALNDRLREASTTGNATPGTKKQVVRNNYPCQNLHEQLVVKNNYPGQNLHEKLVVKNNYPGQNLHEKLVVKNNYPGQNQQSRMPALSVSSASHVLMTTNVQGTPPPLSVSKGPVTPDQSSLMPNTGYSTLTYLLSTKQPRVESLAASKTSAWTPSGRGNNERAFEGDLFEPKGFPVISSVFSLSQQPGDGQGSVPPLVLALRAMVSKGASPVKTSSGDANTSLGQKEGKETPINCVQVAKEGMYTLKPQVYTNLKPQVYTTLKPQVYTTLKPQVYTPPQPQVYTTLKPQVYTTLKPQLYTPLKPQVYTPPQPQVYTTHTPQVYTTLTPQVYTTLTPQVYTTLTPQVAGGADPHFKHTLMVTGTPSDIKDEKNGATTNGNEKCRKKSCPKVPPGATTNGNAKCRKKPCPKSPPDVTTNGNAKCRKKPCPKSPPGVTTNGNAKCRKKPCPKSPPASVQHEAVSQITSQTDVPVAEGLPRQCHSLAEEESESSKFLTMCLKRVGQVGLWKPEKRRRKQNKASKSKTLPPAEPRGTAALPTTPLKVDQLVKQPGPYQPVVVLNHPKPRVPNAAAAAADTGPPDVVPKCQILKMRLSKGVGQKYEVVGCTVRVPSYSDNV